MGSFADSLQNFRNNTVAKQNAVVKEVVSQVALSLITKSPVGNPALWKSKPPAGYQGGKFKANWQYGLGEINPVTTNLIDPDGGATLDRIIQSIPDAAGGYIHFVTNSLPYARVLEDGSHSQQVPPFGMVGLTVIEFEQIVGNAVKIRGVGNTGFGL